MCPPSLWRSGQTPTSPFAFQALASSFSSLLANKLFWHTRCNAPRWVMNAFSLALVSGSAPGSGLVLDDRDRLAVLRSRRRREVAL